MPAHNRDAEILTEINRLIQSAPPPEEFYYDIPERHEWLGEVENALTLWDAVKSAGVTITINSVFNSVLRNNAERQALLIKLTEARRSLQMKLGISASRYLQPTEAIRRDIGGDLSSLKAAIQASNAVDPESKMALLAEIAAFEATIAQPRVSADLIYRFVNGVLRGAAMKVAGATADEIASRMAIAALSWLAASLAT
jgi:hypothetical protein